MTIAFGGPVRAPAPAPPAADSALGRELAELESAAERRLDSARYVRLIKQCAAARALAEGRRVHAAAAAAATAADTHLDLRVGSSLINMYLECGSVDGARLALSRMDQHDPAAWNAAIAAFARKRHFAEAVRVFERMRELGSVAPNAVTLLTLLNFLKLFPGAPRALAIARDVHAAVVAKASKSGGGSGGRCGIDPCVAASLITLYGRCGCLRDARGVFADLALRDRVAWSAIIAAYARNGRQALALLHFRAMQLEGIKPNQVVFVNALCALVAPADLREGRRIHALVVQAGLQRRVILATALIAMYGRCASPGSSLAVFRATHPRDLVVWNAMIGAYAASRDFEGSLRIFATLLEARHVAANRVTFMTLLAGMPACGGNAGHAKVVEREVAARGLGTDVAVATALASAYGRCGRAGEARRIFDGISPPPRSAVAWNALLSAYVHNRRDALALDLYRRMLHAGVHPTEVTFVAALGACSSLASVAEGRRVLACVAESGFEPDDVLGTAVVDMYGKCGNLDRARGVFDRMRIKDVVVWSALAAAYAQHGADRSMESMKTFHKMQQEGVRPGDVAFLSVLAACRNAGLVDRACAYFSSISRDHGLEVTREQLSCMVDLLGRAGWLAEAEALANRIPNGGDAFLWTTLLGACRTHGDFERARRAGERALELNPKNGVAYVMLSQMYADAGRMDEAERVKKLMMDRGVSEDKEEDLLGQSGAKRNS